MLLFGKNHPKRKLLIVLISLLVIGAGAYYFLIVNKGVSTAPSTSAKEDEASIKEGVSPKNSNSQSDSGSDKQASSSSSSGNVASPQGNFVSSHHVSLTSNIESVCVTSKGATCEITFTQGGTSKSLGKKNVDSNGSATWLWTPSSANLNTGSWEINATASLNGSETKAKDPMNLEVAP